jgi:hypothetical protein
MYPGLALEEKMLAEFDWINLSEESRVAFKSKTDSAIAFRVDVVDNSSGQATLAAA